MNASIRSKIAAVTVALVASAGFATSSVSAASAESDGQRAVEVQTDGTVIEYVVTNGDVWRTSAESPEQASAVELQSDGTSVHFFPSASAPSTRAILADADADSGSVQVGTAGDTRYVLTDHEVIWGHAAPTATLAVDRMGPVTEIPADGGPVYLGMAGNIKYIVTSNEVIWGVISPGTTL